MIDVLKSLINSLNMVEVHGANNLALLWNSIDTLKQLLTSLENARDEQNKSEEIQEVNPSVEGTPS